MEFDEIVMKESPGLCRCCLSEGCYKDMGTEYAWMNENEVYADMLLECFDISISQHHDGPNGPNRLICEVCITRLRDACYFKKQVLDSEKKFIDMVGRGEFRPKAMIIYQQDLKAETSDEVKVIFEPENAEVLEEEYLEDEMEFGDDEPLKSEDPEPTSSDVTAVPLPVRGKRGRPRKTPAKPEKKKVKTEPKAKSSKALVKERADATKKEAKQCKKIREDMTQIVRVITENSTIMPFRWSTKNYFTCFYCGISCDSIASLKQHTHTDHEIDKSVKQKGYYLSRIKLDVSDISCKKCPKNFENLEEFLDHCSYAHDLKFNKALVNNFVCFKLSEGDLICLHCGELFAFFGTLLMHDNRYHNDSKIFTCDTCGEAFISKNILASHIYYKHDEKRCKICNQVFKTAFSLTTHTQRVHDVEKLKCPECDEILGSRYLQKQHLKLIHGVGEKQLVCDICSRSFVTKKTLRDHKARVHLKEKSFACEICGFKVFSRGVLTLHMVKHSDARPFACDVCQKTFRRKKTLETHMKLHKNYKPYKCMECDKTFVQSGNLKKHIRVCHSGAKDGRSLRRPSKGETKQTDALY